MLELNKEYTYSQICECLGWKLSAGNSKKAQIKEIERCFEWYHPINNKTHKEKKSYIFTKQLKDLVEPSLANSAGNNTKNIKPMAEYIQGYISDDCLGEYKSMTAWYCDILNLLDKELCVTVYYGDDIIESYCEKNHIHNSKLLCDYVSSIKAVLKDLLIKSLKYMEKNRLCTFYDGYIFTYEMGRRTGYIATDCINDIIIENEIVICNDLKEEHKLSKNLKNRQLLMQIYNRKDLTDAFDEFKVLELMNNDEAIKLLNEELDMQHGETYCTYIDSDHPLTNYYRSICVSDMDLITTDTDALAKEITGIIRDKARKNMYLKGNKNEKGDRYYIYNEFEHGAEMDNIDKLLFVHHVEPTNSLNHIDVNKSNEELDNLFNIPQNKKANTITQEVENNEYFGLYSFNEDSLTSCYFYAKNKVNL